MPLLFTLFFGFVMGSASAPKPDIDPRLPVGVIDQDGGSLATNLKTLLENSEVVRPVVLDEKDAKRLNQMVEDGALAAVVIIPDGYTTQLLADQPGMLEVIVNQSQPAGQTASRALETVTGRLLGAVEAAHISKSANQQSNVQDSLGKAIAAWEEPALTVSVEKATGNTTQNDQATSSSGYAQASAGMMVQFSIFGLITSAMVLVLERKSRTLQRLLSSPIRRVEVIAGHVLAMFCIVFAQQLILVLVGQFVFGVDYARQPLAILLMITVLSLWAASLGIIDQRHLAEGGSSYYSLTDRHVHLRRSGWSVVSFGSRRKNLCCDWTCDADCLGDGWVPKHSDAWLGVPICARARGNLVGIYTGFLRIGCLALSF